MQRLRPFFCFFLLVQVCLGCTTLSLAQLPDGSIAPDFTATDIQGVEHNLYDLLDEGKKVILEFSATWCPPCWAYHTNGVLDALYTDFGPNGTDELRIFFIESSDSPLNTLYGEGDSQGDWVSNTQYPIIDNGEAIFSDYQNSYWPTIYTICPNQILTESSQNSYEGHAAIFQANDCAADFVNVVTPFWSHDCNVDYCGDWVFGNGAGEVGSPWEDIDLNFECSTDGPAGPYNQWAGGTGDFGAASAMNSTTAANGLLIVDSDLFGADTNYDAAWIENSWVQTANSIDCSEYDNIRMTFQSRYRCWDNGASDDSEKCLVEISRDGLNWPDISTFSEAQGTVDYGDGVSVPSRFEVFPGYETGSQTDNPSFIDIDISAAAAGQSQVWVRFRWAGTWGFSWEIDDILLQELPENDIKIDDYASSTDYANTGIYELGAVPFTQALNFQAGVLVKNIGSADQTGVQMGVKVDGEAIAYSQSVSLPNAAMQSLQAEYSLAGMDLGLHSLELEVFADEADQSPADNSVLRTFEITEYQLGRDNGIMTGAFPDVATDDFISLASYNIVEDLTVYAIDVAIAAGSDNGVPVIAHLYDGGDANYLIDQYGGLIASTSELNLTSGYINDGTEDEIVWYTLVFDNPVELVSGSIIGAAFEHYGGASIQIGQSQYADDASCFIHGPFGSGGFYGWFYTNETPMVRLNLDPNAVNTSNSGCVDPAACNYNPEAVEDDASCNYPGCEDPIASNYDSSAGCSGECIYFTYDCASIGDAGWAEEEIGLFPEWQQAVHGLAWEGEWVFNIPATLIEPESGISYGLHHIEWSDLSGLPSWIVADYALAELDASSQHCIAASGIPSASGIHEVIASGEVFVSLFGQPFSIGFQSYSAWLEVLENPNPIPGCTYVNAVNYLAYANIDDGTCSYPGCMDSTAGNYNPYVTEDDGSCGEMCNDDESSCTTDVNSDGFVNVSDLLILLSEFGISCE